MNSEKATVANLRPLRLLPLDASAVRYRETAEAAEAAAAAVLDCQLFVASVTVVAEVVYLPQTGRALVVTPARSRWIFAASIESVTDVVADELEVTPGYRTNKRGNTTMNRTTTDLLEALNDWTTRYNDPATREAMVEAGANWWDDVAQLPEFAHLIDFDATARHEETRSLVILKDGTAIDGDRGPKEWFILDEHADNCEDCL